MPFLSYLFNTGIVIPPKGVLIVVQTWLIQPTAYADDGSASSEDENMVAEENSSNTLRLVEFFVPFGSLGDYISIPQVIFRFVLMDDFQRL